MFVWTEESIRFRGESARYTGCYDILAGHASKYLPQACSVFEGGCGLGHLSMSLARRGYEVTAMDNSPAAVASFREEAARTGARVNILEGDIFRLPADEVFDCAVFCFFGGTKEILDWGKTHCRDKLIMFKKNWNTHRFTKDPGSIRKFTFPLTCEELDGLGVAYKTEVIDADMGQPFRSVKDAEAFFRLHDPEGEMTETDILPKLTETGDPEYPYYLSALRPVGMIIVSAADINNHILREVKK
ncbi:MAG: class I SAM-dependent methyltransferase [Lachnospiraceae bacterium]|nr:class I SAM-dependent methyltransferase [Lachnospiraceae bacterium]